MVKTSPCTMPKIRFRFLVPKINFLTLPAQRAMPDVRASVSASNFFMKVPPKDALYQLVIANQYAKEMPVFTGAVIDPSRRQKSSAAAQNIAAYINIIKIHI